MIVVADASVLVAELTRIRGLALFLDSRLDAIVSAEQWSEAEDEISRRLALRVERGYLSQDERAQIQHNIQTAREREAIEIAHPQRYAHLESVARRRIPRDPNDWPTVALALALDAGILTNDYDFFGCGCPTWTVETLRAELANL